MAEKREASYTGLVMDHNAKWCNEFAKAPNTYREMLQTAIEELKLVLEQIPAPT